MPNDDEPNYDHARRLDVHTWSDHPEVNSFVDFIYDQHFGDRKQEIAKRHIKLVLLDLFVNWQDDPTLFTSVSLNNNDYAAKGFYNELHISNKTITVVKTLADAGLIGIKNGFLDRRMGVGRIARIWPNPPLVEIFGQAAFDPLDVWSHDERKAVVLRDDDMLEADRVDGIPYEETDETRSMEEFLRDYNNLLRSVFIDNPHVDHGSEFVISQRDKYVRRIFNRGTFEFGGRFYGGWWQNCPKELRDGIFMNGWATTEIDFSGLHIVMLYALEGINYWSDVGGDPYDLNAEIPDFVADEGDLRRLVKQLSLTAINAKKLNQAYGAFRFGASNGHYFKRLTNQQLSQVADTFVSKHQAIAKHFGSDAGISLQRRDSNIAQFVLQKFLDEGVPALSIHDSFIVPTGHETKLVHAMVAGFAAEMGIAFDAVNHLDELQGLKLKQEPLEDMYQDGGLMDEWTYNGPGNRPRNDAVWKRQGGRATERYKQKRDAFKSWRNSV